MEYSEQITDPAAELVALADFFRNAPVANSNQPTHDFIAQTLLLQPDSIEALGMLSIAGERFASFSRLVSSLDDPFIADRFRSNTLAATGRMGRIFIPSWSVRPWHQVKQECLSDADIGCVESFSSIARKHRPLRKLSEAERQVALDKIDEILNDENLDDFPAWVKGPLLDGLQRLRVILKNLVFFGHEAAIDQLVGVVHRTGAVQREMESIPYFTPEKRRTIYAVLTAISVVVAVFKAPVDVAEGYKFYKGYLIEDASRVKPGEEQKLLSPPKNIEKQKEPKKGSEGRMDA